MFALPSSLVLLAAVSNEALEEGGPQKGVRAASGSVRVQSSGQMETPGDTTFSTFQPFSVELFTVVLPYYRGTLLP